MVLTASETRKQARESLNGKWGTVVLVTLIYLVYNFLVGLLSSIPVLGFIVSIAAFVIDIPIIYGFVMTMMKLKRGEKVDYFDFFKDGFANFKRSWCVMGRMILKMIVPIIIIVIASIVMAVSMLASLASAFAVGLNHAATGSSVGLSHAATGAALGGSVIAVIAIIAMLVAYIWLIIKSFSYALSMFIAIDNPNMRPLDCVNRSKEVMDGNKGHLFGLYFSFIGWFLLAFVIALAATVIFPPIGAIVIYAAILVLLPYIEFTTIVFYENKVGIVSSATVAEGNVSCTESTDGNTTDNINNVSNTANTIKEKSGSTDVKAEIVDIPEMDNKNDENNNE